MAPGLERNKKMNKSCFSQQDRKTVGLFKKDTSICALLNLNKNPV
jgi:hypothetical protein